MLNSERFQMTSTKFPNTPKPTLESFPDGFPKPIALSVSESSEVVCFHEPLLACQSNQSVNFQASGQVNQTVPNQNLQFAPVANSARSQLGFVMHDPWNEPEEMVEQSLPVESNISIQGFPIPFVPTLMKVGEDPNDPWNHFVPDVEPYLQPIPHFGSDSEPKQTGHQPNTQPTNKPVLLKAGEDIHDPWNICDQPHRFYNLQQQTLQTSSCSDVDPRNAL